MIITKSTEHENSKEIHIYEKINEGNKQPDYVTKDTYEKPKSM